MAEARPKWSVRGLARWEIALALLILAEVALRFMTFAYGFIVDDSAWYATMAESLLRNGEFVVPWAESTVYTQHFPPAYPAFMALVFALLGPSMTAFEVTGVLGTLFLAGAALFTTWDLYGRRPALAVTAVVLAIPELVLLDRRGLSESFVAAWFALTIWAIVRSLERPKFIVLGGLFAAMGYLSKASMGPFFILAGFAGLAWRFYYVRWRVFTDRWYLAGAAVFASAVLLWAGRNVARHGWPNWETQRHASDAMRYLFSESPWPLLVGESLLAATIVLGLIALPFWPGLKAAARRVREESTSALWLAVLTPTLVAVFFVAAFAAIEHYPSILRNNVVIRYVVTPIVPLLWLGMRAMDLADPLPTGARVDDARVPRREAVFLWSGVALVAVALATQPTYQAVSFVRAYVPVALVLAGLVVMMVARAYAWRASSRKRADGSLAWRAEPVEPTLRPIGVALGLFVVGFVAARWLYADVFFFFVAAAVGALAPRDRDRALAVALVLFGACLFGASAELPVQPVVDDIVAAAPADATVSVLRGKEIYLWPFLPEDVPVVPESRGPTFIVRYGPEADPPVPDGYHLLREYPVVRHYAPGSFVEYEVEKLMGVDPQLDPIVGVRLYERNPTS